MLITVRDLQQRRVFSTRLGVANWSAPSTQAADGTGSIAEQIRNRPSENRLLESQS